jgi:Tol biopolymer transport system component
MTGPAQLTLATTYPGTGNGRLASGVQQANGNVEISSVQPNGHGFRQLTDAPGFNACAAYSPDGNAIVFCSDRTGAFEIWTMRKNGSRQTQVMHTRGFMVFPISRRTVKRLASSAIDAARVTRVARPRSG